MTRNEAIEDLKTLIEFFERESGATPVCMEYAIEKLENTKTVKYFDEDENVWTIGEVIVDENE